MGIVLEFLDFILKALLSYAATPEGKKEIEDIFEAAHGKALDWDEAPSERRAPGERP
jgi:hypothetical protein